MPLRIGVALILACLAILLPVEPAAGQTMYFAGDGSAFSTAKWGTAAGGPFDQNFTAGSVANFGVVNGTGTGASIVVGGLTATENFTLTAIGGTISNQGNGVVPISVASGMTLDFNTQAFTTSTTAGYIKTGPGVLALAGNTYQGGFTLNEGTVILRGINAMGGGVANTLTINGGTIAANDNRTLTDKFGGGITVGGNFTVGATTGLANPTSSITFTNAVNLGGVNRTITVGGVGTYFFSGLNNGGLTVAVTNPTGVLSIGGNNTHAGGTTIQSGARLRLAGNGSQLAGNVANDGEMQFVGDITYGGVISGTGSVAKQTGNVTLTGANTYTGRTFVGGSAVTSLHVALLANGGQPSNIGTSSNVAANLVLGTGTLNYTGPGVTTDRLFSVGALESHLASNGTGPLDFANTGEVGFEGSFSNPALYLEGTNTGANTLALKTVNPPVGFGALSVRKMGSGTWILTGDSTHTGFTAVLQGALYVNGMQVGSGATGASVSQHSKLGGSGRINGGVFVQRSVNTLESGGLVRGGVPGTTGTLTFAGGAAFQGQTGTGSFTGKPRGAGIEVEASRTGGNGTNGTADASRLVFGGSLNFRDLDTGTPGPASPKFTIEIKNGTNPLWQGESYTITLATATEVQRNSVLVGEFSSYTFDPNDYVLTGDHTVFSSASLQVVNGNTLQLTMVPVPEPGSVIGLAAVGLVFARVLRRRIRSGCCETISYC